MEHFIINNMAQEIFNPDKWDLIREAIIVAVGFVIRFFELRKRKNEL